MLLAFYGPIAQLVEQRPFKPRVPGSSPGGPSKQNASAKLGLFVWPSSRHEPDAALLRRPVQLERN